MNRIFAALVVATLSLCVSLPLGVATASVAQAGCNTPDCQ